MKIPCPQGQNCQPCNSFNSKSRAVQSIQQFCRPMALTYALPKGQSNKCRSNTKHEAAIRWGSKYHLLALPPLPTPWWVSCPSAISISRAATAARSRRSTRVWRMYRRYRNLYCTQKLSVSALCKTRCTTVLSQYRQPANCPTADALFHCDSAALYVSTVR